MKLKKIVVPFGIAAATVFLLASAPANAQATRTWVSGVGDDVNPCSRTAPCKTFAGAISKTVAGGEIDVLDPGGFGAVTDNHNGTYSALFTAGTSLGTGTITATISITDPVSGNEYFIIGFPKDRYIDIMKEFAKNVMPSF